MCMNIGQKYAVYTIFGERARRVKMRLRIPAARERVCWNHTVEYNVGTSLRAKGKMCCMRSCMTDALIAYTNQPLLRSLDVSLTGIGLYSTEKCARTALQHSTDLVYSIRNKNTARLALRGGAALLFWGGGLGVVVPLRSACKRENARSAFPLAPRK